MNRTQKIDVNLPGGNVTALRGNGLIRARGIRYARASRFQPPQAELTWTELQGCTLPAPVCPQNPSRLQIVTGDLENGRTQDEDCLRLTVAAPELAKAAPVVVFLHGGAYVSGGGDVDAYSPQALASKGVVGVSVSYRLGVLGYLPIPDVAPANLGLLDQIQALRWIQKNIEGFGGDPNNITIIGQSAGAEAIYCLMVADGTQDLFHRAIPQSMPLAGIDDENRDGMTIAMSKYASDALADKDPQTVDVSFILNMQKQLLGLARTKSPALLAFGPRFGEHPLPPKDQIRDRFMAAAKIKPLFLGYTADESTAFKHIDTRQEANAYLYKLFQGSTDELLDEMERELGQRPPMFEFAWYPTQSKEFKATHCIDLPFILGDWSAWKDAPMLRGDDAREVVVNVGESVKQLWVDFASGRDFGSTRFVINENFKYPRQN